mgnify:CR=1 FL=1
MAFDHDSTIAQFVFDRDPSLNLAVLVKELDAALERSGAGRHSVTWDCEDLAFVDLDGPLLLKEDRSPAIRFDGSLMHPAPTDLWG